MQTDFVFQAEPPVLEVNLIIRPQLLLPLGIKHGIRMACWLPLLTLVEPSLPVLCKEPSSITGWGKLIRVGMKVHQDSKENNKTDSALAPHMLLLC